MDTSANEYLKGVIEAILFISEKPVTIEQFNEVLQESVGGGIDVKKLVEELREEYETKQRGMVVVEIAGGYQMLSSQHYASYVRNFLKTKVKEKLSRPALETLAIVAYKQPVSRGDVELVRGVNSDGVVLHLLNKSLIKIVGKKDVPGRPFLYGTTKLFLEYFGLKSLRDLPKLEDVSLLLAKAEEQMTMNMGSEAETAPAPEMSNSAASQALDEAEAQSAKEFEKEQIAAIGEEAAKEAPEAVSEEQAQAAGPISAQYIETARENVKSLLDEDEAKQKPKSSRLTEVIEESGVKVIEVEAQEKSVDMETIIAEEMASLAEEEQADNPPEEKPENNN